jgi:GTP-binding protein EngB required for normal cell division
MPSIAAIKPATAAIESTGLSAAADSGRLRVYTRSKLALATQLRALLNLLKKRGSESRFRRCEQLMVKLAEDRFTLAVVGQFKRGKSSLMNAIIGRDLLPTGVLPLTSAITVLRFGASERVVVHREGLQFPEVVPISALANYVTERGNPGNRKKVKTAAVEVTLPFLRRGLEFVDTPGVGSSIEANSATTYKFLPECDAVIFVTSVDTPFTEAELDFLSAIREHVRKIFFVVNKTDLLRDQRERDEVFKFIESELRAEMKAKEIRLFPVSSRLAMTKSDPNGPDGSARSGLKEFQETLASFLADEKAAVFLTAIIDKALRLVDEEFQTINLHQRARKMPKATVLERLDMVRSKWRELENARRRIFERLSDDLSQHVRASSESHLDERLRIDNRRFSRHLRGFMARGGWRPGDDVANHWTTSVSKQVTKTTSLWIDNVRTHLNLESQPALIKAAKQIEANLRDIPKVAAATFDLQFTESKPELPRLREQSFAHPPLGPKELTNDFGMALRFLPVRMTATWLKPALNRLTSELLKIYRTHALALISDGVKTVVDKWAFEIDALASGIESRATSAITGEQTASQTWRQTSSPLADPGWGALELTAIRAKLIEIRDAEGVDAFSVEKETAGGMPTLSKRSELLQPAEAAPMPAPAREIDFASDLRTRGCAVCDHVIKTAYDFLTQWQYALASDEKAQRHFAADSGFCSLHAWQLHSLSSPLGESIGLAPLAEEISRLLGSIKSEPGTVDLRKIIHTPGDCRVCRLLEQVESDYVTRFNEFLTDENNRKLYVRSQGVCLRHLARLIPVTSEEIGTFLLGEASRHFGEFAEDMQSYAIKRDAIRRHLMNVNEEDAYMRALIHLAGAKDYCTPWPEDREI